MKKLQGFSFIELIITLAVLAVLSSMMLTFSGAFLQDNRMATANNNLVASINLARSAAVSSGQRASICSSSNGLSCTGSAWENGWIVFLDAGTAGVIDATDKILKVSNNAGIDITVYSPGSYLQFKPQGAVASVCVNCFDKTLAQRMEDIFVAAINNLSPVSNAFADSGSSGNSGDSGNSGGSGDSGGLAAVTRTCVAPPSQVTGASGDSGNSGNSGGSNAGSGDSGNSGGSGLSFNVQRYTDYALNALSHVSPIASANASSGLSGGSGTSGGSGEAGGGGVVATCNKGEGTAQEPIPPSTFLICDSSNTGEKGKLIEVSTVGRIVRTVVYCD